MKFFNSMLFVLIGFSFLGVINSIRVEAELKQEISNQEQLIKSYKFEISALEEKLEEYKKQQEVIIDCVLNGRWQ